MNKAGPGVLSDEATAALERVVAQTRGLVLVSSPTGAGNWRVADALRAAMAPFDSLEFLLDADQARHAVETAATGAALGVMGTASADAAWQRLCELCAPLEPAVALAGRPVASVNVRLIRDRFVILEVLQRDGDQAWDSGSIVTDGARHVARGDVTPEQAVAFCGAERAPLGTFWQPPGSVGV